MCKTRWSKFSKKFGKATVAMLLAGAFALPVSQADAAGFYIQEQSVSGLGTAYAGQVAKARDASIIFYNPAGMTHLDKRQVNLGIHMIAPHLKLNDTGTAVASGAAPLPGTTTDGGNPGQPAYVPNGYFAMPLDAENKWWAGMGMSAPFGLGSKYNSNGFSRFLATKSELKTVDIQPAIAYQATPWLSIGANAIIEHISANLKQFAITSVTPPTFTETEVSVKGDDWSAGWQVGFMVQPWDTTTIGVNYRSKIKHTLIGTQEIVGVSSSDADASLTLPDIFTAGFSHDIDDKWTVLGQVMWTGWNDFDRITTIPDSGTSLDIIFNYQTSWAYSIGAEYKWNEDWILRAGYQFDQTPTTDRDRSTTNPDGDRHWISAGATYTMDETWSFDFGATYIDIAEEEFSQDRTGVTVEGESDDAYVGIISAGVNYKF